MRFPKDRISISSVRGPFFIDRFRPIFSSICWMALRSDAGSQVAHSISIHALTKRF